MFCSIRDQLLIESNSMNIFGKEIKEVKSFINRSRSID